jgi:hypothetical protein
MGAVRICFQVGGGGARKFNYKLMFKSFNSIFYVLPFVSRLEDSNSFKIRLICAINVWYAFFFSSYFPQNFREGGRFLAYPSLPVPMGGTQNYIYNFRFKSHRCTSTWQILFVAEQVCLCRKSALQFHEHFLLFVVVTYV